ncbi:MAG: metalloregulator ArsR/SmtB family transcription factor [Methanolinea sp.]|jgi:ArsR family transcriptional regulator|nr:metalloregulator ArsR/SmtB family transcription factor [Methanolinea sp.]
MTRKARERGVGEVGGQPAVPADIAESLRRWGGIEGLVSILPPASALDALQGMHQACSDAVRLKILFLLEKQPLCVCVIKNATGVADSRLSYHIQVLKKAGLIGGNQQGNYIIYRITPLGKKILKDGRKYLFSREDGE